MQPVKANEITKAANTVVALTGISRHWTEKQFAKTQSMLCRFIAASQKPTPGMEKPPGRLRQTTAKNKSTKPTKEEDK